MDTIENIPKKSKELVPRKGRPPKYATEEERIQANKANFKKYRQKNKEILNQKNKEYYIKKHYLTDNVEYHYNTKYYQEYITNKDVISI